MAAKPRLVEIDLTADDDKTDTKVPAVEITTPTEIHYEQLDAEISAANRWRNPAGITVDGDPTLASAEQPVRVYIGRWKDLDSPKALLDAVTAHTPDPQWTGAAPGAVEDLPALDDLKAKAAAGQVLSATEIQAALKHLLLAD